MTNDERLLGRLEEFAETTKSELKDIKTCLEDLKAFKWKVIGGSFTVSLIASAIARFL